MAPRSHRGEPWTPPVLAVLAESWSPGWLAGPPPLVHLEAVDLITGNRIWAPAQTCWHCNGHLHSPTFSCHLGVMKIVPPRSGCWGDGGDCKCVVGAGMWEGLGAATAPLSRHPAQGRPQETGDE